MTSVRANSSSIQFLNVFQSRERYPSPMILRVITLIFAVSASSSFVYAEDKVPESLLLIGRGIQDRSNQNTIALACTKPEGNDCKEIRVVEFTSNSPHWLTRPYQISGVNSLLKDFRARYKQANRINVDLSLDPQSTAKIAYYGSAGYVAASYVILKTVAGISVATAVTWMAAPIGALLLVFILGQADIDLVGGFLTVIFAPVKGIGNTFQDFKFSNLSQQDGWNWAIKPKMVSSGKYSKIQSIMLNTLSGGSYQPQETQEETASKLEAIRIHAEKLATNQANYKAALSKNQVHRVSPQLFDAIEPGLKGIEAKKADLAFSPSNSEDKVCKALGYEGGLVGSAEFMDSVRYEHEGSGRLQLTLDDNGEVIASKPVQPGRNQTLTRLTCFGLLKKDHDIRTRLSYFHRPMMDGMEYHRIVRTGLFSPDDFCKKYSQGKAFLPGVHYEDYAGRSFEVTSRLADGRESGLVRWDTPVTVYSDLVCWKP